MASSTDVAIAYQSSNPAPHSSRVIYALQLLQRASSENPIEEVARAINVSSSRLRHLVKQETGISPTQFIKESRLRCAKKLLVSSTLLVKQVMWEAGFTDLSHFVRDYKKMFGETPSETRSREFAAIMLLDHAAVPASPSHTEHEIDIFRSLAEELVHVQPDSYNAFTAG
ncbi:MAG: AraC family transcriptional regulator [Acidobacteriales bacterium]|nr:AraC family transcriptional regulator [Terriglobales bacterium]